MLLVMPTGGQWSERSKSLFLFPAKMTLSLQTPAWRSLQQTHAPEEGEACLMWSGTACPSLTNDSQCRPCCRPRVVSILGYFHACSLGVSQKVCHWKWCNLDTSMSISYWQRFGIHLTSVLDRSMESAIQWRELWDTEHSVQWRKHCWHPSEGSELGYRKGERS